MICNPIDIRSFLVYNKITTQKRLFVMFPDGIDVKWLLFTAVETIAVLAFLFYNTTTFVIASIYISIAAFKFISSYEKTMTEIRKLCKD